MKTIKKIVLTGGPCSGKSTFMEVAQQVFPAYGYHVFLDHEAATDLISGGLSPATMGMYQFQKYVISLQLQKEEIFNKAAEEIDQDKVLILMDRGILDDKGYVSAEEFKEILKDFNIKEEELNGRYDMVVHLETSAKGSASIYTLTDNIARYEDVDEAIKVDNMIVDSWSKHPVRVQIAPEDDVHKKLDKAIEEILKFLGEK
ncbi:MAG: ATP-binding protein [Erysipelotrichaceae bacterium]|nr:ATP-binding protein [Erysipelotrichaceae bacterium]